jgi:hypothetical protein
LTASTGATAIKVVASCLRRPFQTWATLDVQRNTHVDSREAHARRAADWLLRAQAHAPDGRGYSRRFSLMRGWDRCYVETTGYIIPTMLDVADRLRDMKYAESADAAGRWLLEVQSRDGAFREIDQGSPQVFDTGQVLLGLTRLYRHTSDDSYLQSAVRAALWLESQQDPDGAWRRNAYNSRPHSYYSRVAGALIELGVLTGDASLRSSGERNLEWVLLQEGSNGYFGYSEFRIGEDALLHTIVYVLEGFLIAYQATHEEKWASTAMRGLSALVGLVDGSGLLHSQYSPDWSVTNNQRCVTGLAQFAGACFEGSRISSDKALAATGSRVLDQLCRWQARFGTDIKGALPSSIPVWGYYGSMDYYNWNMKFFLDAILKEPS